MNILFGERRSGRTTELIKQAVKENAYILVYDHARALFVRKLATEMGYPQLLFPITFQELMNSRNTGFVKKLLIDDADEILESLCVRQGWEVLMMALCKREGQFFELPGNGKPPELSPELKPFDQKKTRTEPPCDTCQTRIDRCGCQMHLCSDYQKWKEGEEE